MAALGKVSAEVLNVCASVFSAASPAVLTKLLKPNAGSPAMKNEEPKATGGQDEV